MLVISSFVIGYQQHARVSIQIAFSQKSFSAWKDYLRYRVRIQRKGFLHAACTHCRVSVWPYPEPVGKKWPATIQRSSEISRFEVLDLLFCGLKASPVALASLIESKDEINRNFLPKKYYFLIFFLLQFLVIKTLDPDSVLDPDRYRIQLKYWIRIRIQWIWPKHWQQVGLQNQHATIKISACINQTGFQYFIRRLCISSISRVKKIINSTIYHILCICINCVTMHVKNNLT